MEGAILLTEARAGHDANASRLEQLSTIIRIWYGAGSFCLLDELLGKCDAGEGVHGALNSLTAHPINGVERVRNQLCLCLERS